MEKAAEQCIQQRQTVVMLVPEDMSVGWFSKALESVDEVRIITDGRINFIEPSTGLEKKGNSKGSMLLIWRPFNTNHGIQISFTTKITGRGQQWLTRKLLDNGMLKVTGEAA